jgi:hypothetical protein
MSKQWNLPPLHNESHILPYKGEPTYIKLLSRNLEAVVLNKKKLNGILFGHKIKRTG